MIPNKPHENTGIEQSVLGAIIIESDRLCKIEEYLSVNDFYLKKHQLLYENLIAMRNDGEKIDVMTIAERLKRQKVFNEIGGTNFLTDLVSEAPLSSHLEEYCKIIKNHSLLRKLVETSQEIINSTYEEFESVSELIENAEKKIFNIAQDQIRGDFLSGKDIIPPTLQNIHERVNNKGKLTGVPSGFKMLDYYTSGFQCSDLIYLAARPSMGKTALALNIAINALFENLKVAIFSLEMSKEQLMERLIASDALVDLTKIRKGDLSSYELNQISNASAKLYNCSIFIDDTGGETTSDIRSKLRRLKSEHGLDLVVIDYLQLMRSRQKTENRQNEISEISRSLKSIAKEMNCPILCLSQLSRAPDSRPDHRPVLSDLRDSGSIEQDADVVLFLYREHYYDKNNDSNINNAELIVAKQRNGPLGTIKLAWRPEWTKFTDIERV